MPKIATFDSTVAAPSPVNGWFDTDAFTYALPPADDQIVVTEGEWDARLANPSGWAVSAGALVAYAAPVVANWKAQAQAALDASDTTILRCSENGISPAPVEWRNYRAALRAIVSGGSVTALPTRPAYPAGT